MGSFLEFLQNWLCKIDYSEYQSLKTVHLLLQDNYAEAVAGKLQLNEKLKEIENKLKELVKTQPVSHPKADYWNNRKPKALIYYKGRYIPKLSRGVIPIDIRLMVMPQDHAIQLDIKNYNLEIDDPLNCNGQILKLYKFSRTNPALKYSYSFDDQQFKVGEFWMFPFELRETQTGDCEDWGLSLASYLIGAGVPNWRVRCVAGTTWGGIGHATVYVLGDDLKSWIHLNSTTPISMIRQTDLMKLPKSNQSSDNIGIRDVWFSWNDEFGWHQFETSASKKSFVKDKAMRKFKITPAGK